MSSVFVVERILWVNPSASQIVTIELTEQRVLLRLRRYDEIVSALDIGAARVAAVHLSAGRLRAEREIPESRRRRRDEAWELIAPVVADGDPEVMSSRERRGKLVVEIAARSGRINRVSTVFCSGIGKAAGAKTLCPTPRKRNCFIRCAASLPDRPA